MVENTIAERQKILEGKLEDLWGVLKYAVEMDSLFKKMKEHYRNKLSLKYHHRCVFPSNDERKYSYGYDITFFVD